MKALALLLLFAVHTATAQVAFVEKGRASDLKNATDVIVVLASEDTRTLQKLNRTGKEYADAYQKMVNAYNLSLRIVFARNWTFTPMSFMEANTIDTLKLRGANEQTTFIIATSELSSRLSEAALQMLKRKSPIPDLDQFLVDNDDQGSLDIFALSQWAAYKTSRTDWEAKQAGKMKMDKKLGKTVQPGDYLRHRTLEFVGFFLSQHALPTRSDLAFGLHYLQADLAVAMLNNRKLEVNKPVAVRGADMSKKTLLIGRDLVYFPNGKLALKEADIKAIYPHPFKIVGQAEIEKAVNDKSAEVAVMVPMTRWSATGYPELHIFYVVDVTDGFTVLTYADTGSGSNPMTANNFEKSAELKAKHFQELLANAEK